jgi:hypothetical protein
LVKLRVKAEGSQSLARVATIENEYGIRIETPAYALRADYLGEYIAPERVVELGALVELDVGSPALKGIARHAEAAAKHGIPFYISLKPTVLQRAEPNHIRRIAEKLAAIADRYSETYIATIIPVELIEEHKSMVQNYCRRYTCIAMLSLSAPTRAMLAKQTTLYQQLVGEGLVDDKAIAVSNMKASLLSERRAKLFGEILLHTGRNRAVISYGSLSAKTLKTAPETGLAVDLAQYHLQVDIAGPTRTPKGAPPIEPKKRLLIPTALIYIDLTGGEQTTTQLLQGLKNSLPRTLRGYSPEEIPQLPQSIIETANLEEKLAYLKQLRETGNPDAKLNEALETLKRLGLQEAIDIITKALRNVKRKLQQRKLTANIKPCKTSMQHT